MRLPMMLVCTCLLCACATHPPSAEETSGAFVPSDASAEEVCAVAQCAHDVRITLARTNGEAFDQVYDWLPVVQQDMVSVYPGMTVYFETDAVDGHLANFKRVDSILAPGKTITSTLTQDANGSMMLVTRNPYTQPLQIRMGLMRLDSDRLVRTSSCTIPAGASTYEMWPYPVFQIVLADMQLLDEGSPMACKE